MAFLLFAKVPWGALTPSAFLKISHVLIQMKLGEPRERLCSFSLGFLINQLKWVVNVRLMCTSVRCLNVVYILLLKVYLAHLYNSKQSVISFVIIATYIFKPA